MLKILKKNPAKSSKVADIIASELGIDEFGRTKRKIYIIAIPLTFHPKDSTSPYKRPVEEIIHLLADVLLYKANISIILNLFPGSRHFTYVNQFDSDDDAATEVKISLEDALSITIGKRIEDEVNCKVYTPKEVISGNQFLVQVYAHTKEQAALLEGLAKSADGASEFRATTAVEEKIARLSKIEFHLLLPNCIIDDPVLSVKWTGEVALVQFGVEIPATFTKPDIIGKVIVVVKSIPIGQLKFKIKVHSSFKTDTSQTSSNVETMVHFKQAFISYASQDRSEVLKRVQMLHLVNLKYFHDLLTLESGQQWEKMIYANIARSDVFFLFWSKAASESKWVKKEIMYALKIKESNKHSLPEIVPVIIEGPPPTAPPAELSFLHFNDKFIYFINSIMN
ncbi:MAG: toll/interleukin-1 receptor domain-containing protein [Bacteroidota bacterium]|nr:toll/interleukin-1 receptor domain-containing protein [Bacteroidota bacterium]